MHLERTNRRWGDASRALALGAALLWLVPAGGMKAQEHAHSGSDEHEHDGAPHFTHPLFAESISPDTKIRLDYAVGRLEDGESVLEGEIEGEYAFTPRFSIEGGLHVSPETGDLGESHVLIKFADPIARVPGFLVGYGVQVGLPTGSGHHHEGVHEGEEGDGEEPDEDVYTFAPFINAGRIMGRWEVLAWTLLDIPAPRTSETSTALRFNGSVLLHGDVRFDALVETFGRAELSGDDRVTVFDVAPGVRIRPFVGEPLVLGTGIGIPLTSDRDHDARLLISAFWHF